MNETQAREILQTAGERVTGQRLLLLRLLLQTEQPLDANQLYLMALQYDRGISLSTVYRNLNLFKSLDLIDELKLDVTNQRFYEPKKDATHSHLLCLDCGKIVEVENPLEHQLRELALAYGFSMTSLRVDLAGHCTSCPHNGGSTSREV